MSKNLYNQALYRVKKQFKSNSTYLSYYELYKQLADENQVDYRNLPQNVSAQVLISLHNSYKSYFTSLKSYKQNPNKFKGLPKPPKFLDKINGRYVTTYTDRVISSKQLREKGLVVLGSTSIKVSTIHKEVNQVRIVPKNKYLYVIEIIYEKESESNIISNNCCGIDLGLNNLATLGFNNRCSSPLIINGKPLKAINQYYNKTKAKLQSKLINKKSSKRIRKLTQKRNNKIKDYLHKSSRKIADQLKQANISSLVIGKNKNQKQEINIGDKNNQNFVSIPHDRFIHMITYKCQLFGIKVNTREESYTSKCSFADQETIRKHNEYKGKRIKRGLFESENGFKYNADLNGALNILRKEFPNSFTNGIEDLMVSPKKI
jgi:IS605 OrfB family transposase